MYHLASLCSIFADRTIPALLQDVIERVVGMQIMTVKPDSCIIDFFNEVFIGSFFFLNKWSRYEKFVLYLLHAGRPFTASLLASMVWASSWCSVFSRM